MMTNELYGLVLVGGKSSRMKTDKSFLSYHGRPQIEIAYELLSKICSKTFISCRQDQSKQREYQKFPAIHDLDQFKDSGPLSGILSAMKTYPNVSWLVMACDLPYVQEETLKFLINKRDHQKLATAFKSAHDSLPEPLCAVWEAQSYPAILNFLKEGINCPRKILIKSEQKISLIEQPNKNWLDNVNSPDEYKDAIKTIKHPS